jgi:hypothetical protein
VKGAEDHFVTTDLSTLLTALYVRLDDWPGRPPRTGHPPKLSDAELLTLAVAQALLSIRSALAGWAGYGYCPSHSRFFWGLRLHLARTPAGLPVTWALASPKIDERQVLAAMIEHDPDLVRSRPGPVIIADKGYVSKDLDRWLEQHSVRILRPTYRNLRPRPGEHLLKPIRQLIESINDTLKGQLGLELHGGRTAAGVTTRIAQRLLALTAAIWHNRRTSRPITRSLIAYDH